MKIIALYLLGAVIFWYVRSHDERDRYLAGAVSGVEVSVRTWRKVCAIGSIIWPIGTILNIISILFVDKERYNEVE